MCSNKMWCVYMFSPEFMKFLINYQKEEFTPKPTKKVIYLNNPRGGKKLPAVVMEVATDK